jgi:tetratricopeptide (TPR) repeat protein
MTSTIDPSNPYQERSQDIETVDFLQYPRETLKRKSGDCDDLVILYASALESLGIRTMVIDIPGHMFMMFEIGSVEDLGKDTLNKLFVIHEGSVWIPIEATLVGKTFMKAWEEGSKKYYQHYAKKQVGVMDLRASWAMFKPANLPAMDWRAPAISREVIEKKFHDEFKTLRQIRVKIRSKKYILALDENPKDVNAYIQLGIVYAEAGDTAEAQKSFKRALEIEPQNSALLNNLGNTYFIEGMYGKARKSYEDSISADPKDPYVWVNLSRALVRLELKKEGKDAFSEAYRLDPSVANKYRGLSLQLLGPI